MRYKRFFQKPLMFIDRKSKNIELLFKQKKYPPNSPIFKIYYLGLSVLVLIALYKSIIFVESIGWEITIYSFYSIVFTSLIGTYLCLSDNGKYKLTEFRYTPRTLTRRVVLHKSLDLNFSPELLALIYNHLINADFIKKETTSFGAFKTVLMKKFGHNQKIVLNLTLAQIRSLFGIFEKYSKNFARLAIEHELFLHGESRKIEYGSYRNTKSTRNLKARDSDFVHYITSLNQLIVDYTTNNDACHHI